MIDNLAKFRGFNKEKEWYIKNDATLNKNILFTPQYAYESQHESTSFNTIYSINVWTLKDLTNGNVIYGIAYRDLTPEKSIDVFQKNYDFSGDYATSDSNLFNKKYHEFCELEQNKEDEFYRKKYLEEKEHERQEKAKYENMLDTVFLGYLKNRTSFEKGRIYKILNKSYAPENLPIAEIIEQKILNGEIPTKKGNNYYLRGKHLYDLNKTEYEYALFVVDIMSSVDDVFVTSEVAQSLSAVRLKRKKLECLNFYKRTLTF